VNDTFAKDVRIQHGLFGNDLTVRDDGECGRLRIVSKNFHARLVIAICNQLHTCGLWNAFSNFMPERNVLAQSLRTQEKRDDAFCCRIRTSINAIAVDVDSNGIGESQPQIGLHSGPFSGRG
jgi:hypothetical protein